MAEYSQTFARLVNELSKLPNIGMKTAEKMAYRILTMDNEGYSSLLSSMESVRKNIGFCSVCGNMTDVDPCPICTSPIRRKNLICVVRDARDISAIERMRSFDGVYHVLGGLISPMDNITPDKLKIKELIKRVKELGEDTEVILALSMSAEGETTCTYLIRELRPLGVNISRIAYGIPVGGELEYADGETLSRALFNRSKI